MAETSRPASQGLADRGSCNGPVIVFELPWGIKGAARKSSGSEADGATERLKPRIAPRGFTLRLGEANEPRAILPRQRGALCLIPLK